jgi:MFS family permease
MSTSAGRLSFLRGGRMSHVALLMTISFLLFMAGGLTGPMTSLYLRMLGASYAIIGLLGTQASLTNLVFSYAWGHISDRMRQRKLFLVIGLGGITLSYGLMSLIPNFIWAFPLRLLTVLAQSAYGTASLALMGDLLEHEQGRGRSMGTYRGLGSLGFGLMAFIAGFIADRSGLRVNYALGGVLTAMAFLLSLAIREPRLLARTGQPAAEPVPQREKAAGQDSTAGEAEVPGKVVRRLPMVPLLVSAFIWSLAFSGVYAVWANYMVERLGYSQTAMSQLWSIASTSEFPFMILAGWLSDRVGRMPMLSLGFLCWTLVFAGYIGIPAMPWIVLIQLTRGFAFSAYTATAMTYAAEVRSQAERGRASGLFGSAGGLGSIIGSAMGGALAQLVGFVPMIVFGGSVYMGVNALRWRMQTRETALS